MPRQIIDINGLAPFVDYQAFETSFASQRIAERCENCAAYFLNNFPIVTTEVPTNLLLIIAVQETRGNVITFTSNAERFYLNNIIIPIRCVDIYAKSSFAIISDELIEIDGTEIDISHEKTSLKFGIQHFLSTNCDFDKNQLFPIPLIFFQSNTEDLVTNSIIVGNRLTWDNVFRFIQLQKVFGNSICSYKPWKMEYGYDSIFLKDIQTCVSVASEINDSNGYLTKQKLERLAKNLSNKEELYSNIGQMLITIEGKAGTGKTNELLKAVLYVLTKDRSAKFLTYNNLLTFDIAYLIKRFIDNRKSNGNHGATVMTIHKFLYRLARQLGILIIMSEERSEEIINVLAARVRLFESVLSGIGIHHESLFSVEYTEAKRNKESVSNSNIEIGLRRELISFLNFNILNRKKYDSYEALEHAFVEVKSGLIRSTLSKEVFRTDYYGVLKDVLNVITDPAGYFSKMNIIIKNNLLKKIFTLQPTDTITLEVYLEKIKRKLAGFKHGYFVFVDEGQDCHPLERDILIRVFGSNKLVVASGGKEQLIRHLEVCNWHRHDGKAISHKKLKMSNKSFRMKKNILELCNFLGKNYSVRLDLLPIDSEDPGKIIIDFRPTLNENSYNNLFDELLKRGHAYGCSPYESLLVMLDVNSLTYKEDGNKNIVINEYQNVEEHFERENERWAGTTPLETFYPVWDGTIGEKSQNDVPYPGEIRIIHYESCRGLEAWATLNMDIDSFFDRKANDEMAEKYLSDTIIPLDERKQMFAGTWLLLALTRAIDTVYLKCSSKNTQLGKVLYQYAIDNPQQCSLIE